MHSYIDRGRYCEQIRRLWRWFGRENVQVLRHEELITKPQSAVNKVCQFLSIDNHKIDKHIVANQGTYKEKIDGSMQRFLVETLKYEIQALEKLLGWDCSDWLEGQR